MTYLRLLHDFLVGGERGVLVGKENLEKVFMWYDIFNQNCINLTNILMKAVKIAVYQNFYQFTSLSTSQNTGEIFNI